LKVTKWGAFVCVGWLIVELVTLIVVGSSNRSCPGRIIHSENGAGTSLWLLVGVFTAAPAMWLCYVVYRWDRFMERAFDAAMGNRPSVVLGIRGDPSSLFLIDSNKLCLRVIVLWCLFCAVPLWMILFNCTDLPQYLEYWHRYWDVLTRRLG
jgi:hypothetical protein